MGDEPTFPTGLLLEFFSDLIGRVIPGIIFLVMFFWCKLIDHWEKLNDWQSAIYLPFILVVA